jgi:hypothetical protein
MIVSYVYLVERSQRPGSSACLTCNEGSQSTGVEGRSIRIGASAAMLIPVILASRTMWATQVAHLYKNLSIGACFDKCGLAEGRRRIHGYSNNDLALCPEGSRRANAFIK